MAEIEITNCHIHTFTMQHVQQDYPHRLVKWSPGLVRFVARWLNRFGHEEKAAMLDRLAQFQAEASAGSQQDILDRVMRHYPEETRFVVLPMDLSQTGHGPVQRSITEQHNELAALASRAPYRNRVIPFVSVDPRAPGAADEVERRLANGLFRGLKLYPRLGYPPDHQVLMDRIYPLLVEHDLPVMTHCSRGGVIGRGLDVATADRWSAPQAWIPVWQRYPTLRVCLAHFGGQADWADYVQNGIDPNDAAAKARNWQVAIRDMIECGDYPGLWTDISYTLFHFDEYIPFLKVFLETPAIAEKVLFGSDFYMTRQEKLSERAVCFRLRVALGEDVFRQIAETNPRRWLGEPALPLPGLRKG